MLNSENVDGNLIGIIWTAVTEISCAIKNYMECAAQRTDRMRFSLSKHIFRRFGIGLWRKRVWKRQKERKGERTEEAMRIAYRWERFSIGNVLEITYTHLHTHTKTLIDLHCLHRNGDTPISIIDQFLSPTENNAPIKNNANSILGTRSKKFCNCCICVCVCVFLVEASGLKVF